jgi:2-methylcitrate dehydratase PrpD
VVATVDESIAEDAADLVATLPDGTRVPVRVEHAIGSLERPMSDADLEVKFRALVEPVLGPARVAPLLDACWQVARSDRLSGLAAAARA